MPTLPQSRAARRGHRAGPARTGLTQSLFIQGVPSSICCRKRIMSQAPRTMPQKKRTTPRSARKSTMGVIGGISARSCRPAAASILQTQDRNVAPHTRSSASLCPSSHRSSASDGLGRQARAFGVWRQAAPGQRLAWRRAAPGHEDGQDRHLMEQPMLGRCGSGTGWPARVSSMAARSSSPVTGLPLPGVDWSNAPR